MMPLVLTPTWETCTKECGAGLEMMFALTGLVGNDDVLGFSFLVALEQKGRKTAVYGWGRVTVSRPVRGKHVLAEDVQ